MILFHPFLNVSITHFFLFFSFSIFLFFNFVKSTFFKVSFRGRFLSICGRCIFLTSRFFISHLFLSLYFCKAHFRKTRYACNMSRKRHVLVNLVKFLVTVRGVQIQILHIFESLTLHLLFIFAFFKSVLVFFLYA